MSLDYILINFVSFIFSSLSFCLNFLTFITLIWRLLSFNLIFTIIADNSYLIRLVGFTDNPDLLSFIIFNTFFIIWWVGFLWFSIIKPLVIYSKSFSFLFSLDFLLMQGGLLGILLIFARIYIRYFFRIFLVFLIFFKFAWFLNLLRLLQSWVLFFLR